MEISFELVYNYQSKITAPDASDFSRVDALDRLAHIQIDLVDTNFGTGRAGESGWQADGLFHVTMNVNQFVDYGKAPGGMEYLFTHEMGHSLPQAEAYGAQMWGQYLARPEVAAMTPTDQAKNYPSSTEFALNERWANSLGRAILTNTGLSTAFVPPHGYF